MFACASWVFLVPAFDADHFTRFLETLHVEKPFELVRFLMLPTIHRFDPTTQTHQYKGNPCAQLLSRCTVLRELHMKFYASIVCKSTLLDLLRAGNHCVPLRVDEVLDYFELRSILNCTRLCRIELYGVVPVNDYRYQDFDSLETLAEIGRWIKKEFAEQGKKVEVVLKRSSGWVFHMDDLGSEEL